MAPLSKDLVDDLNVRAAICELYGLRESDMGLPGISERVADLDARVEQARREGRLIRYARKDPVSGFVAGYCYKRVELYEFLRTQPGFQRRSAQKAQQDASNPHNPVRPAMAIPSGLGSRTPAPAASIQNT